MPMRCPTSGLSVVWMSHLKPLKSTMISYCMPLKVMLVTVPVSMAVLHGDDIDILRADDDVHRLVLCKALVHALEAAAERFDHIVLTHDAVENVALADEVRHEGVLRFIIYILRRADLLDACPRS